MSFFINLFINDQNHGVYAVEESFSKELVERQKKRNGPIFSLKDELGEYFPNVSYEVYSDSYWTSQYPKLTKEFLFSKGVTQFQLVESLGATEAYPFTGSANLITDISSTGETIKSNNLRILKDDEILKSQACIFTSNKNFKKKGLKALVKLLTK